MKRRAAPAIGVLGHYGNANLGDEAIIQAVMDEIRRRWPDAAVYAISNNPGDSAARYGVPAVSVYHGGLVEPPPGPVAPPEAPATSASPRSGAAGGPGQPTGRRGGLLRRVRRLAAGLLHASAAVGGELGRAWRCYRRARGLDLLLVAGSNQMLDNFGGPWGFPYLNFRWSLLARLAGCRVAWLSVGAGPLEAPLSRRLVRASVRLADYVSVRDEGSRRLLAEIGVRRACRVFPDLAHGLRHDDGHRAAHGGARPGGGRPVVGINVMPIYDERYWPERSRDKYRRYVRELAALTTALIGDGREVFLFGTHPKDALVAEDVLEALAAGPGGPAARSIPVRASRRVEELLEVIESADAVVATRFHGALLSLLCERPVLALCYYRKTRELMLEHGQDAELAVALDDFDGLEAARRVGRLLDRAEDLAAAMRPRSKDCRAALAEQYELVFQLVADR
jgi:polysaccharide pyruvyl transferase WcaK-like protein